LFVFLLILLKKISPSFLNGACELVSPYFRILASVFVAFACVVLAAPVSWFLVLFVTSGGKLSDAYLLLADVTTPPARLFPV